RHTRFSRDWSSDVCSSDLYVWDPAADVQLDWQHCYDRIFDTNIVLDNLDVVSLGGMTEIQKEHIKGAALFVRAWNYLQLAQLFRSEERRVGKECRGEVQSS